jgi:hypothetical protein
MSRRIVILAVLAVLAIAEAARGQVPGAVAGSEYGTAVNLTSMNLRGDALVFVPPVTQIRAALVVINFGEGGRQMYASAPLRRIVAESEAALVFARFDYIAPPDPSRPFLRDARLGSAELLFSLLQRLGDEAGRPELRSVPLLFWGWSQAASFGPTFASGYPERTLGFVRYHTHRRGIDPDLSKVSRLPSLSIAGGTDQVAGSEDAEAFWKWGRAAGAPWAFAIEPGAPHWSWDIHAKTMEDLTIPWIAAILKQGTHLSETGRPAAGWLVNHATGEAAAATGPGTAPDTSWLPDEGTATAWRTVTTRR